MGKSRQWNSSEVKAIKKYFPQMLCGSVMQSYFQVKMLEK